MDALSNRYKQALIRLRPKGRIWKVTQGSVTDRELSILAEELAKLHIKAEGLVSEAILSTTRDFLSEWEDIVGLPHEGTYDERILALLAASEAGSQHKSFYINLARQAGVSIDIVEHCPFMFGASQSGGLDELGAEEIIYYWEVLIKSGVEENITKIRHLFAKYKQSHTVLTFLDLREI